MKILTYIVAFLMYASLAGASGSLGSAADATVSASAAALVTTVPAYVACVIITNSGANDMRFGDALVSATRGARIPAGGSATECTSDVPYGYSASGTTANLTFINK